MKLILIALLAISTVASCFSQQTDSSLLATKPDYLLKSKHQKTAAWVLLGGGLALCVGGAAVSATNWQSSGGDVMMVIGGASMLGSIPLFIAAGKNKRRAAASASLKMETAPVIQQKAFVVHEFPAVSLQLNL